MTDLASQLNDECEALRAFIVLLEKEQQALLQQDNDQLLALAEAKTQSANKLAAIAHARRTRMGPPNANLDTSAWIMQHAPASRAAWDEVRELAARAHQLNQTNGEVIQLKLRSNQQALTALMGAAQNVASVYGRDGHPSLLTSGRVLGSV